jgi:hypothetical protein
MVFGFRIEALLLRAPPKDGSILAHHAARVALLMPRWLPHQANSLLGKVVRAAPGSGVGIMCVDL